MPQSALATGLIDYVLAPADMPVQLIAYVKGPYLQTPAPALASVSSAVLQKILSLLRGRTGHDFSGYKGSTIYRRLARRMNIHQVKNSHQYIQFLQEQPHELDLLFKEFLIGVSGFFRDPEAFAALEPEPLTRLLAANLITILYACGSPAVPPVKKPIP